MLQLAKSSAHHQLQHRSWRRFEDSRSQLIVALKCTSKSKTGKAQICTCGSSRSKFSSSSRASCDTQHSAARQLSCMARFDGGDVETARTSDQSDALKRQAARNTSNGTQGSSSDSRADMSGAQTPFGIPGQLVILGVAVLWGTNPPALRYLYNGEGPPSAAAVAGVQASAAAAFLLLLNATLHRISQNRNRSTYANELRLPWQEESQEQGGSYIALAAAEDAAAAEAGDDGRMGDDIRQQDVDGRRQRQHSISLMSVKEVLNASTRRIWLAGTEIGVWAFLANACTVSGFQNTAASKGAFLIRLSAIFTPLVAALAGESVTALVWMGCAAALSGSVLMGASHSAAGDDFASTAAGVAPGDALLILAALMWSIQTVRLGKHARRFPTLPLASVQMLTMAVLSDIWLLGDIGSAMAAGKSSFSVWEGASMPLNWVVMLWPSVGPWGAGTALQVAGQTAISSSQTQILLASDPLWATAFAGLLASAEQDLGTYGWIGGALIFTGAVLAGFGGGRARDPEDED